VPLLGQVLEQYPTQVKLVFKNFPLRNHTMARPAALAALAAGEQGKFWELHDLLFQNFSALNAAKIDELARQAGLDMQRFAADRASPTLSSRIDRDLREGSRVGVRATPSIFVDGRQLRQRSLAGFKAAIEAALARQR
jgi:protein-disulfide isomerase